MRRVAFLCCHLSGTGHLVRTLALARAVEAAGGRAMVISGGRPLAHLDAGGVAMVQIPPLDVPDFDFANPRGADGAVAGPETHALRRREIGAAIRGFAPDVLVTETFPLGRRRLAAEFEEAIAAAGRDAVILASVRDVPEPPKKPARLEEAARRIETLYDAVLVHGDARILPLSASWPLPPAPAALVLHTGHIGPARAPAVPRGRTVLVSGGGGVLGRELLETAATAAALTDRPWHLLTGGADAAARAAGLAARHPGIRAEPARADYRTLLAGAACSVSLCGYNTVMDLAACDTPAVIVPFEGHGEREQLIRADRLATLPGITVLSRAALTTGRLAAAVEATAATAPRPPLPLTTDGAARAADLILTIARRPRD